MAGQWLANGSPMAGQWLTNGWPAAGQLFGLNSHRDTDVEKPCSENHVRKTMFDDDGNDANDDDDDDDDDDGKPVKKNENRSLGGLNFGGGVGQVF